MAGSRSAVQSAGGRKKDEIWDLVKNVEKSDHERRQGDEREALGVQILTVLFREVLTSS